MVIFDNHNDIDISNREMLTMDNNKLAMLQMLYNQLSEVELGSKQHRNLLKAIKRMSVNRYNRNRIR